MSTETVSPDSIENTRRTGARIEAEFLQRLADVGQTHAAAQMGVSDSTVSRMTQEFAKFTQLMAALGFQLAPSDAVVVSQADIDALERMAFKYLQSRDLDKRRI